MNVRISVKTAQVGFKKKRFVNKVHWWHWTVMFGLQSQCFNTWPQTQWMKRIFYAQAVYVACWVSKSKVVDNNSSSSTLDSLNKGLCIVLSSCSMYGCNVNIQFMPLNKQNYSRNAKLKRFYKVLSTNTDGKTEFISTMEGTVSRILHTIHDLTRSWFLLSLV